MSGEETNSMETSAQQIDLSEDQRRDDCLESSAQHMNDINAEAVKGVCDLQLNVKDTDCSETCAQDLDRESRDETVKGVCDHHLLYKLIIRYLL